MAKNTMVDTRVHDLAEFWLSNDDTVSDRAFHDARVMSLAQDIQVAIEGWCEDETRAAEEQSAKDEERRALQGLTDAERERI